MAIYTENDLKALLERIDVTGFAIPMTLHAYKEPIIRSFVSGRDVGGMLQIRLCAQVRSTLTAEFITIRSMSTVVSTDDQICLAQAIGMIRRLAEHELDECLLLDGKPVRDPHPEVVKDEETHA